MNTRVRILILLTLLAATTTTTTSFTWLLSYSIDAHATHVSKPIPYLDKKEFLRNETIDLKGWVKYNGQPASDVLVQVWLEKDEVRLIPDYVMSKANGNFSAVLSIPNDIEPGNYTVTVTSLCQEIDNNVCTFQFEEFPITIRTR